MTASQVRLHAPPTPYTASEPSRPPASPPGTAFAGRPSRSASAKQLPLSHARSLPRDLAQCARVPHPYLGYCSWSQVMPPKKKGRGAPRGNDNAKKNKEPEPVRALAAPTMHPP